MVMTTINEAITRQQKNYIVAYIKNSSLSYMKNADLSKSIFIVYTYG